MLFGKAKTEMPAREEALPGRGERSFPLPESHRVLGTPLEPPFPEGVETAYFAMGCFWGAERLFWLLDGVHTTAVGYQNGFTPNPTYEEVCSGRTGHAESVLVAFRPDMIPYERLVEVFFAEHDPTQGMRQGNDVGTEYRSGIFCADQHQLEVATAIRDGYQSDLERAGFGAVTTAIEPAGPFYYAEPEHQQYLDRVPNGYCGLAGTGVACRADRVADR
jgi:peptide-methionine (S)-S-oxide reductase